MPVVRHSAFVAFHPRRECQWCATRCVLLSLFLYSYLHYACNIRFPRRPTGFITVGSYGLFTVANGIAVSSDGGASYTPVNISVLQTETRYGSFPTADAWYVSAGQWPSNVDGTRRHMMRSARAAAAVGAPSRKLQSDGYIQQIVKSTDSGQTWSSVNIDYTSGYLNGIDCLDESRCCAAGEQDDETDGYGYIICTADGGISWQRTLTVNETGASFLDLRVIGPDGYWAVGGVESVSGSGGRARRTLRCARLPCKHGAASTLRER